MSKAEASLDWEKFIFCQETSKESLQCPADSKRSDIDPTVSYESVAKYINRLEDLKAPPMKINKVLLEGIVDVIEALTAKRGKWHKKCQDR